MTRPPSIVSFGYCYLASLALGVVNTATSWSTMMAMSQVQQATAILGAWYMPAVTLAGFAIPLLLWYLVAVRASVIAKWIIVAFAALAVLRSLYGALSGGFLSTFSAVLSVAALVLALVAASLLFKPDARAWFGEDLADAGGPLA